MSEICDRGESGWRPELANGRSRPRRAADRKKLEHLREQLPALQATRYFNAGSNGPIPQVCSRRPDRGRPCRTFRRAAADLSFYGRRVARPPRYARRSPASSTRRSAEVAIMRSTTEGMNAALNGVIWRPGDEIITTQLEHICLFRADRQCLPPPRRHRSHDRYRQRRWRRPWRRSTRRPRRAPGSIAISHVQWSSGAVMPLREIGRVRARAGHPDNHRRGPGRRAGRGRFPRAQG